MYPRKISSNIENSMINSEKNIIFLWGSRQTGKSTILNNLYSKFGGSYFNFDDLENKQVFVPELSKLISIIKSKNNNPKSNFIFIDEVQNLPESTQAIKLLTDSSKYKVIATGSSELRAKTHSFDSLAGRYIEFILYPLTIDEISIFKNDMSDFVNNPDFAENEKLKNYVEELMVYGSYPKVILTVDKISELKNITQNSIIKDIVNIYDLKNTDLVFNLLRLLANQIGNLINVTEIANSLGSTKITIDNYIEILKKNRVIYLLEPFKDNKRRGYLERKKVYFYDLGIRNSLIEDFRPTHLRQDLGAIFENLIVSGVLRQTEYSKNHNKLYFFREVAGSQKEIDLIVENTQGDKEGFEIKYTNGKINKIDDLGINSYKLINKENSPIYLV